MKNLVEYIAKALVDSPDDVVVKEVGNNLIELSVEDADRGKIIGRKGRTAHAIRTLLAAASDENNPTQLEIVD